MGFRGRKSGGVVFVRDDLGQTTASGPQRFALSAVPIPESLHLYASGVHQRRGSGYALAGQVVTLAAPVVDAAHLVALYATDGNPPQPLSVKTGDSWLYLTGQGANSQLSRPDFDDTAWSSGPTPFGWHGSAFPASDWEATTVPSPMDVWLRRHDVTSGGDLTWHVNVDDAADCYFDGQLVRSLPLGDATWVQRDVPAGLHTFAVHGTDNGNTGPSSRGYLTVEISEG